MALAKINSKVLTLRKIKVDNLTQTLGLNVWALLQVPVFTLVLWDQHDFNWII